MESVKTILLISFSFIISILITCGVLYFINEESKDNKVSKTKKIENKKVERKNNKPKEKITSKKNNSLENFLTNDKKIISEYNDKITQNQKYTKKYKDKNKMTYTGFTVTKYEKDEFNQDNRKSTNGFLLFNNTKKLSNKINNYRIDEYGIEKEQ